jgi:23S rRNA (guanosine2251-2'-O)-methyltransferase
MSKERRTDKPKGRFFKPQGRTQSPSMRLKLAGGLWLFGLHAVRAALLNPERVKKRLICTAEAFAGLEGAIPLNLIPERTERAALDATLPSGTVHQGVALLVEPLPEVSVGDVARSASLRPKSVVLALDQVTDPHNVGAVLRSAAGFGALAVLITDRHAPAETGTLAKAASGGLEAVPLVRVVNLARALLELKTEAGFRLLGLDGAAPQTLAEVEKGARTLLVLGSEGEGIRRLVKESCDQLARLPMAGSGPVDSLNVSNAAAIALYEMAR